MTSTSPSNADAVPTSDELVAVESNTVVSELNDEKKEELEQKEVENKGEEVESKEEKDTSDTLDETLKPIDVLEEAVAGTLKEVASTLSVETPIEVPLWAITNVPKKPLKTYNVTKLQDTMDPFEKIFAQSIMVLFESLQISCNKLVIYKLTEMALEYLHDLIFDLHRLVEIQRRRNPALKDLQLLIREHGLVLNDLVDEYQRSNLCLSSDANLQKSVTKLSQDTEILIDQKTNPNFEIDESDPSAPLFYNQTFEILDLIPSNSKLDFPKYFPQLPPDYTYKKTAIYNKIITDPRTVKEKLVEESRYGELALDHLLHNGQDESEISDDDDTPMEVLTDDTSVSSKSPKTEILKDSIEEPNKKRFDIEAFAKRRMEILQKRKDAIDLEIEQKRELPIYKISYLLGSYTEKPLLKMKDDSIANMIHEYLDTEYSQTTKAVKVSMKRRLVKLEEERLKRVKLLLEQELERQRRGIEQTFEFGNDDDDEEIEDFNFEFEENGKEDNLIVVNDQFAVNDAVGNDEIVAETEVVVDENSVSVVDVPIAGVPIADPVAEVPSGDTVPVTEVPVIDTLPVADVDIVESSEAITDAADKVDNETSLDQPALPHLEEIAKSDTPIEDKQDTSLVLEDKVEDNVSNTIDPTETNDNPQIQTTAGSVIDDDDEEFDEDIFEDI